MHLTAPTREWWMFAGLFAYFVALRLVLKYQTRPFVK